ncbi:MAG: hypothetical protein NVS4B5_17470 [Vulcanimicrobiaceae bacterium]
MKFLSTAAAAVLIGLAPLAASAAVSVGTQLTGSIDQSLSSNHATVGEPFTISNVRSSDSNITGARVYGHVADVQSDVSARQVVATVAPGQRAWRLQDAAH